MSKKNKKKKHRSEQGSQNKQSVVLQQSQVVAPVITPVSSNSTPSMLSKPQEPAKLSFQEQKKKVIPIREEETHYMYLVVIIVLAILAVYLLPKSDDQVKDTAATSTKNTSVVEVDGGALNAMYNIDGTQTKLVNGNSSIEAVPGTDAVIKTSVFGTPVVGDVNGDSKDDTALILVQDPGGSGSFYYVAAAVIKSGVYAGTNAVLLGDRVAPQSVMVRDGVIIANYADRGPDEPMSATPTIGKTKYLKLVDGVLREIDKPEGF